MLPNERPGRDGVCPAAWRADHSAGSSRNSSGRPMMMRLLLGLMVMLLLVDGALARGGGRGGGFSQERCYAKLNAKFDVRQDYRRRGDASARCELGLLPAQRGVLPGRGRGGGGGLGAKANNP